MFYFNSIIEAKMSPTKIWKRTAIKKHSILYKRRGQTQTPAALVRPQWSLQPGLQKGFETKRLAKQTSKHTHTHRERETTHPWPSCLSGWKICPRLLRLGKMGGEEKDERKQPKTQKGWMEGKAAHSKLGLIYFINQDYKFNLQTRGQKFSLTRGPWRTAGLGDHSYYWLHISICLWCSCLLFSLSTIQFFGREVDFNCSYRTRAAFACKPACTSVVRAFLVILGAVHRPRHILMVPPPLSFPARIVFHVIPVNLAGGKGISFPCAFPLSFSLSLARSLSLLLPFSTNPKRKRWHI